ncbi:hypothetical protein Hypma_010731 [Hypsizygus marmoreus]|uniref:Uncharacterized protein n=1 Tax=Hypsizygus marmoreus TaxID=39966 RepID=A0A369JIT6_HYPMA|nr:hypothetical protein Hypma_010731 [Hypsizygus marmoreus]
MNSPPDPDSPISTDSDSPPPEEIQTQPATSSSHFMSLANQITQSFQAGGASKRRLPGGSSFGASSSNRDTKSRRRGDPARLNVGPAGGAGTWESKGEGKREEKDLVDHNVVEYLRKEIGDPFQEGVIRRHS